MIGAWQFVIFSEFLDQSDLDKPTTKKGLLPNAPPEAVKAYEEYRKLWQEIVDSGSSIE